MSVVVRMEMPTSCEKCPACDYEEGNCLLADDRNTLPHNGKRRAWCPILCQLPEGHGRLIEADEFLKRAIGTKCFHEEDDSRMLEQLVGESITIVPAERSEK